MIFEEDRDDHVRSPYAALRMYPAASCRSTRRSAVADLASQDTAFDSRHTDGGQGLLDVQVVRPLLERGLDLALGALPGAGLEDGLRCFSVMFSAFAFRMMLASLDGGAADVHLRCR